MVYNSSGEPKDDGGQAWRVLIGQPIDLRPDCSLKLFLFLCLGIKNPIPSLREEVYHFSTRYERLSEYTYSQCLWSRRQAEIRDSCVAGVIHKYIWLDTCQFGRKTGPIYTYSFEISMNYAAGVEKVKTLSNTTQLVVGISAGSNTTIRVLAISTRSALGYFLM